MLRTFQPGNHYLSRNCLLLPSDNLKHAVIDIIHSGGLINWLLSSSLFFFSLPFCVNRNKCWISKSSRKKNQGKPIHWILSKREREINKSVDIALCQYLHNQTNTAHINLKLYYLLFHKLIFSSLHRERRRRRLFGVPKYLYIHLKWNCNVIEIER